MIEQQLLTELRLRANSSGIVTQRGEVLSSDLGIASEDLGKALNKLARAGFITVLAPPPFLVIRLRAWSGRLEKTARSHGSHSYSSSSEPLKESYRHADPLLREILETLGESDPTSFEGAIRHYSADVIRKALNRVRLARSVRKSRTALFRYLLTKLS